MMGRVRDFSTYKEATLLHCIALREMTDVPLLSTMYPGIAGYQSTLINNNALTISKVREIFSNVRTIERTYSGRFLEKQGDTVFHNILVRTLYNNMIEREAPFDAQALLNTACETYAVAEYSRFYPEELDGEIDWDYVSYLLHSSITPEWPELVDARALALSELYFTVTTVDENGVVTTDMKAFTRLINSGYVYTTDGHEPNLEYKQELSPMALLAIASYRARASSYYSNNIHFAFNRNGSIPGSPYSTSSSPTTSEDVIRTRLVLAEIGKCDALDWIAEHHRSVTLNPDVRDPVSVWQSSDGVIHLFNAVSFKSATIELFDADTSQEDLENRLIVFGKDVSSDLATLKQRYDSDTATAWVGTDATVSVLTSPLGWFGLPLDIGYTAARGYTDTQNRRRSIEQLNGGIDAFLLKWSGDLQTIGDSHNIHEALAIGGRKITIGADATLLGLSPHINTTELEINVLAYSRKGLSSGSELLNLDPNSASDRDLLAGYVEYCSTRQVSINSYAEELNEIFYNYKKDTGQLEDVGSINNLSPAQIIELDKHYRNPDYPLDLGDNYTEREPLSRS